MIIFEFETHAHFYRVLGTMYYKKIATLSNPFLEMSSLQRDGPSICRIPNKKMYVYNGMPNSHNNRLRVNPGLLAIK